ncbi:hypothetical protein [Pseudomonas sp. UBA1879]|jgi:hypothetical protein|uniref:hypothetical protein n=1 Tax=Pseudomonas sp. UBA1879 TaxID=1947305 RepID=UPI0025DDD4F5|nr:hypothetical protein [Pseudomonas sp. UBA1879]
MPIIDRYELSLPGHMRLIDARSALNHLERFIHDADGPIDTKVLVEELEPLVEALHDASDATRPVNGQDAFARKCGELGYINLSRKEHEYLHYIRGCTDEGKDEIYAAIRDIRSRKYLPDEG